MALRRRCVELGVVLLAIVAVGCASSGAPPAASAPLRGFDGEVVDSQSAASTAASNDPSTANNEQPSNDQSAAEPLALADEPQPPSVADVEDWINPEFIFDIPIDDLTINDFEPLVLEIVEPVPLSSGCPNPELFEEWQGTETMVARWQGDLEGIIFEVESVNATGFDPDDIRRIHDLLPRCAAGERTGAANSRSIEDIGPTRVVTTTSGGVESASIVLTRNNLATTVTMSLDSSLESLEVVGSIFGSGLFELVFDEKVLEVYDTLNQAPTEPEILAAELPERVFTPPQSGFAEDLDEFFGDGRDDWINPEFVFDAIPESISDPTLRELEVDIITSLSAHRECPDPDVASLRNNSISAGWSGRAENLTYFVQAQSVADGDAEVIDRANSLAPVCWGPALAEGLSLGDRMIPGVGIEDVVFGDGLSLTVVVTRANVAVTVTGLVRIGSDDEFGPEHGKEFDEVVRHIFEALENAPSEPEIFAHTIE